MTRLAVIASLVAALWAANLLRAGLLLVQRDDLRDVALRQRVRTESIEPVPGRLLDHRGRLLAVSERRPSVFLNPSKIDDPRTFATEVATVVGDADAIRDQIESRRNRQFIWLRRFADEATVDALRQLGLPDQSWGVCDEWQRTFPQGTAATHLVGFRDIDHRPRMGLELLFADALAGTAGTHRSVRDSRGRLLSPLDRMTQSVADGEAIRLTIDAAVQAVVGRELDAIVEEYHPAWATVIVVDVASGAVRAIENRPSFDPNRPAAGGQTDHARRTTLEPGSTVKPLLMAAAVDARVIDPAVPVDTQLGQAVFGSRQVRDAHHVGIDLPGEILVHSSNVGAAYIAGQLGPARVYNTFRQLGLDQPVATDLPLERTGRLTRPEDWSDYSLGSHAIGYELAITPLHLAAAYATLSRGGVPVPLRFLEKTEAPIQTSPRRIWSPEVCRWLTSQPLRDVLVRGTARRADVGDATVFGKTGTAQKYDPELGYASGRVACLFAGGVPAAAPRLVAVVIVDSPTTGNGRGGGSVAAPAAVRILRDADRLLWPDATDR